MRIVRLANFIMPRSGGLRTALRELGEGYAAAGHEPVLVQPGVSWSDEMTGQGRVITLPGMVRGLTSAAVDAWTSRRLQSLTVDVAVVGVNGMTAAQGLTTTNPEEASAKRAMLLSARRRVVPVISGQLGRMVAERLHQAGHDIAGIDRRPWPGAPRGVKVHEHDIRKRQAEDVFRTFRPDAVVHMATVTHLVTSSEDRYKINLIGTRAVFDHCGRDWD